MKTTKRIVSLILVMLILVSMGGVGFAEDTRKLYNDTSILSKEKVANLYQKQGKSLLISDSEKVTFLDTLSKKQELELEKNNISKSNFDKMQATETEIMNLNAILEQLPVIEMSYI